METVETIETVVIGGGQAGLSVGYHLSRLGRPFVILEAAERVGDAWRERWDSLRLFTPARFDALDGMPFPAPPNTFPTKDEMADYLEAYAERFRLPVRTGARVDRVGWNGRRYEVTAGSLRLEARNVVVAMATYQEPRVPEFAQQLRPDIVQLHSLHYRNPSQLQDGAVLVVGAGNSGAEIAADLAPHHTVWLSGRDVGALPFRINGFLGPRLFAPLVLRVAFHRILTVRTPIGRKVRPGVLSHSGALIRTKIPDLVAAGVRRVGRTTGVEEGRPRLEDGRVMDVANVVWCTGFRTGFEDWIDLPVHDGKEPAHESGEVPGQPGLYFVGLLFLHALSSGMIHGVGRDAARVARSIARRGTAESAIVADAGEGVPRAAAASYSAP